MAKRPRPAPKSTSAGEIGQLQHNEQSYAQRNVSVGGVYTILGALNTAKRVGFYASLRVVNTDTSGHYVAFGDAAVTAPSSVANGHWIGPGQELFIQSGDQGTYVRADSATVAGYQLVEQVVAADDNTSL